MIFRKLTIDLLRSPKKILGEFLADDARLPIFFYVWMSMVLAVNNQLQDLRSAEPPVPFIGRLINSFIWIVIYAFSLWITGKIFKTGSTFMKNLNAHLIPLVPFSVLFTVVIIPILLVALNMAEFPTWLGVISYPLALLLIPFAFYQLYIQIVAIATAHRVSFWKGFWIQLMAGVLMAVFLFIIGFAFAFLMRLFA